MIFVLDWRGKSLTLWLFCHKMKASIWHHRNRGRVYIKLLYKAKGMGRWVGENVKWKIWWYEEDFKCITKLTRIQWIYVSLIIIIFLSTHYEKQQTITIWADERVEDGHLWSKISYHSKAAKPIIVWLPIYLTSIYGHHLYLVHSTVVERMPVKILKVAQNGGIWPFNGPGHELNWFLSIIWHI